MVTTLNKEKYINALGYFIEHCNDEKLGLVKLNKLFYYLDFISYRDRKKSVTGEVYKRLPKGPVATHLNVVMKEAQKEKIINCEKNASKKYGLRNRFELVGKIDKRVFDEYENELLSHLCTEFKGWTTDQIIAQTHTEAPWVFSEANKPLDYKNADDIEFFATA